MEIVLKMDTNNYQKVKDLLLKDDLVSRSSMVFKEGTIIGKEGYYCYISGTEEQCKKALEINKELVEEVEDNDKEEIINKIKEEENRAIEGLGNIFG